MLNKKMQSGRSMIEILAVLLIMGVISVGGFAGFKQATTKYQVSKMHTDIQSISSDIVSLFSWQRSYPDSSAANFQQLLCTNDIFPDGCVVENGNYVAYNPFGGIYTITTDTTNQTMTVVATNIPLSPINACNKLKVLEWQYAAGEPVCTTTGRFQITFQ